MNATQAAALQPGQRIQWSDHHIDEVVGNDGAVITVKRGPGYAEMKVPPALPPRGLQPVTMTFAYGALADAGLAFANPSLTEDAPVDGKFYARDGKNGKWVDVSGGVAPPTIDAGIGLTMNGTTIDLDPARVLPGEIGGINEAPSDGTPYVRQDVGWVPAAAGAALDFGIGLELTGTTVDLQPATPLPGEIGGINEPVPSDTVVYARKYDLTGVATWEPITTAGITISDTPPMVPPPVHGALWWESDSGNTFIWYDDGTSAQWVQIAPGEDGGRDGPPIFYGIGLTRTGLTVDLDPATDLLLGGLTEPLQDGLAYARKFDSAAVPPAWVWEPTTAAGLQITGLIPDKTIIGDPGPLTINAYGSEFTATCVLYFDGVAMPTTFVTATHLTTTVDPSEAPGTPRIETVTVEDTVGPVIGAGAEAFEFMVATTQVDYGTGLSLDTVPTPPMVNLDPAGPTNLGGVFVPVRTSTQGLAIDMGDVALGDPATGELTAPLATPDLAGSIVEPPADAKGYVRTTQLDGTSQWVPPAAADIAGHTPDDIGIVFVPERTQGQGLTLADDGGLYLRPATDQHLGGILEPPETGRQFARQVDDVTRLGEWVEVSGMEEPPMDPVALWGRSNGGDRGWLPIPEPPPAMEDVPADPTGQQYTRQHGNWHPVPPPSLPPRPAGKTEAEIGIVFVPDRLGLAVGPDGQLALQPAEADQIGGLREVPGPGEWVRKQGAWEQYVPPDAVTYGIGINLDGDVVNLQPATGGDQAGAPEIGGVYGTKRSERNGIAIDSYGHISAPLATELLAGTIIEPPADAKGYVRTTQLDGTSQWVPPAPSDVAALVPVGRSPTNGLENGYDDVLKAQTIWVPLATDFLAGAIVEPPADGLRYARTNDTMGLAQWVPASSAAGVYVSDTPPATPEPNQLWFESDSSNLFLYYTDVDSSQWVQVNIASAPLTGVEEAPTDGVAYVRQSAAWVADTPGGMSQADADLRYLQLTGGTVTGAMTFEGSPTVITTYAAGLNFWQQTFGSRFDLSGPTDTIWMIDGVTCKVDFAVAPTVAGSPIVMMSEHQLALDRIDELQRRLVALERRLS